MTTTDTAGVRSVTAAGKTQMTGAQILVASLEAAGVDVMFGLPGGAILPAYDPLYDSSIRHILVRHEQGAGHAAVGYALATGRVGVCMATSGPGATNLVTALADAQMDSVPVVAITGQVASAAIGTDAFQEADISGITMPVTKHNYLVTNAADIPQAIKEAFHIASTGRPGAVLVDVSKDALQATATFHWPEDVRLPGYRPQTKPKSRPVAEAAELIRASRKPVLYVGGGVVRAGAADELAAIATGAQIPVVTTLMARGAFPDSHELHLGMPGMHGSVAAVTSLQRADLLIAVGTRFDDRVTGKLSTFAPEAKVIHIDIDPAEIGKNRYAEVGIVADAKLGLAALHTELVAQGISDLPARFAAWRDEVYDWRDRYPLGYNEPAEGVAPQFVIERIGAAAGPDAIYVSGVGQHQMWASQFISYERPGRWMNSGGLGTMGFCVPAAMGAKVGAPETVVWAIDGDGCFQMTNQELAVCALEGIPVKVAIINNSSLGMVRQWQTLFYGSRYSNTHLQTGSDTARIPDFVKLAEAYGCVGLRCESVEDVDRTIAEAMAINDRPVVVDFQVSRESMVWPMVAAGTSNDDIMIARGLTPEFDRSSL